MLRLTRGCSARLEDAAQSIQRRSSERSHRYSADAREVLYPSRRVDRLHKPGETAIRKLVAKGTFPRQVVWALLISPTIREHTQEPHASTKEEILWISPTRVDSS